ncbi:MAG TPA: response regulator [Thermodesulfobacteriota bacterium]|nr:response regulator [Thermodesulfobacteriota bacterium]
MAYRVLIIEDSPTMRQLLVFTLKRVRELEIEQAGDGVEGFKKLSAAKFDLILTDINMPVMDGLKFVGLLRNDAANENKGIPIIIITTEGGEAERDKGLALGANSYITKPINAVSLISAVRKHLNIP